MKFLCTLIATLIASGAALARGPVRPEEVGAFVDGVIADQLEAETIAGATVAVVKDGHVLFARGYGLADVAAAREVRADRTLFRIGSITKLFVWTAVMQLVERGALDLDTDVNTYLEGLTIPATFPEPITLTHLMTHTPGFEDRVLGLFSKDIAALVPLREVLAREMPERVRPPGSVVAYSNHGTAIAALVVEQVSGVPFGEYVRQNIFGPLGMTHSTLAQPLPAERAPDGATGHAWVAGRFESRPFELIPVVPAGAMSATATDMARFMIAHLHDGQLGDARILEASTARRMRERLHGMDPRANGIAHGFLELHTNGERVVGHLGDTIRFHSLLALVPEHDVGLFVAYNSAEAGRSPLDLYRAFMNHYYPDTRPLPPALAASDRTDLDRLTGWYRASRVPESTYAKVGQIALNLHVVQSGTDGLLIADPISGERRFIEVEPLVFREENGTDQILFQERPDGSIQRLVIAILPIMTFERISAWEGPLVQATLPAACVLVFLSTFVVWPLRARSAARRGPRGRARLARMFAGAAGLAFVGFVAGLAAMLSDIDSFVFEPPSAAATLLSVAFGGALLTPVIAVFAARTWRDPAESTAGRLYYGVVAIAAVAFVAWLHHWNLLGWNY